MEGEMDVAVQKLLDKQEIYEVLARFMRACDRGDVAGLRACFHPDAVEDHGGTYLGPASAWVDGIEARLVHPKTRMTHCLTNVLIEIEGDRAVSESYVTTTSVVRLDGDLVQSTTCSRLVDRYVKDQGGWLIAHRQLLFEWSSAHPLDESWAALGVDPASLKRGGKLADDPLYAALAELKAGSCADG